VSPIPSLQCNANNNNKFYFSQNENSQMRFIIIVIQKKNQKWNSHNAEDHGEKQLGDTIVIEKNKSRMEFTHAYVQWWPRSW
jgi:non-homologous end joining protein Ku